MPAQKTSLAITERYRSGMVRLRKQGQAEAKRIWRSVSPDDLDGTFNVGLLELTVSTLQREAARLSSAYLASFVASELGEPENPPALSVWDKTFNGNDLREGLRSAVIKAKMAIKDGEVPRKATNNARAVLVDDVGLFIDTAARESLRQGMEMDDRIVGYQRALKGTCGACSGSTTYEAFSANAPVVPLSIHPNCLCISEPIVTGVPNNFPRPTGEQIFTGLSVEKQDEMLGPAAADLVRSGEATLADFVQHDGNFITQKPVEAVKAWQESDHPRGRPGNRGQFREKPKIRSTLTRLKPDIPAEMWDVFNQSTFALMFAGFSIAEIRNTLVSFPKQVKRIKGGWRGTYTVRFQLRTDVEGLGAAGSWHSFQAVVRATKTRFEFRAEEWGGPPELRPGYIPPEEPV